MEMVTDLDGTLTPEDCADKIVLKTLRLRLTADEEGYAKDDANRTQ